jgi:hypothetical protein
MQQDITDPSVVFGNVLVQEFRNLDRFHFDLRQFDFKKVKGVLEANGFKVEDAPENKGYIAVYKPQPTKARAHSYNNTPEKHHHIAN